MEERVMRVLVRVDPMWLTCEGEYDERPPNEAWEWLENELEVAINLLPSHEWNQPMKGSLELEFIEWEDNDE